MTRALAILLLLSGCDGVEVEVDAGPPEGADAGDGTGDAGDTTTDAGDGASDAGDTTADAGPAGEDRVPMFVAYGHAARTLTSCDGGETWIGEHSFEADGHDHSEYSGLGRMAYGDGHFVGCAGWGNPTRVVVSDDGLTWDDLPDEAFVLEDGSTERPRSGCAGVVWDGTRFGFVAGGRLFTSPDARAWTRHPDPVPGSDHIRAVGGGDGLMIYIRGGAYLSDDAGDTWFEGAGYDNACSGRVQRSNAILAHGDRVLITGRDGVVCVSDDRGRTFRSTAVSNPLYDVVWDGARYVGTGRRGELFVSSDGHAWTSESHDSVEFSAIEHGPGVGFVGVDRDRDGQSFFVSDDAVSWRPATNEGTDVDFLWTITFGYGLPSARCPAL